MYMKNSIFLMLVILVPFIAFLKRNQIKKKIEYLIEKIKDKESMSSYSIFVAIVVFINLVFYNSTIPNILSGYLYGVYKGTFLTLIGCIISSTITFHLGKNSNSQSIFNLGKNSNSKSIFKSMLNDIKKGHARILWLVILSRLPPIAPYQGVSVFWSLLNINFFIFIVGSIVGILPSMLFESYIGSKLNSLEAKAI